MQIIGFDAQFDETAHECRQRFKVIIHAAQEDCLADQRNARLNQLCERLLCSTTQFTRVIGVKGDIERLLSALQRLNHAFIHARWINSGHARVDAHDFDMRDLIKLLQNIRQATR